MTLKAVRVNDVSSFPFDPGVMRQYCMQDACVVNILLVCYTCVK